MLRTTAAITENENNPRRRRTSRSITCFSLMLTTLLIVGQACAKLQHTTATESNHAAAELRLQQMNLQLTLEPEAQAATVTAALHFTGRGTTTLTFPKQASAVSVETTEGNAIVAIAPGQGEFSVTADSNTATINLTYTAVFDDDPDAGEVAGQIHNLSVSAHISNAGIFLSDNAGWHPLWIDPQTDLPALIDYSIEIKARPEWSFVASGDPTTITNKATTWTMPRPIDGIAVVGGKHVVQSRIHQTKFGPVEIVMQTQPANEQHIPTFLDAAEEYLDLYTPLLGPFPYQRFSIIENFFSSGFAYPGFTVLGPRVIPMGKRALAPGYLDHEMIHNWWGNGVYVDQSAGNWCEALTTYCANYYRRILDADEEAGRAFRRGILMKLATDPEKYDNAPLDRFGVDPEVNRFIGYDKGAFIFMMLEAPTTEAPDPAANRARLFAALRDFFNENQGRRAGWDDLQRSIEKSFNASRADFFQTWVHEQTLPVVQPALGMKTLSALQNQISADQQINYNTSTQNGKTYLDLDPDFQLYRLIPASEIVPTIGGTTGTGGLTTAADETENDSILPYLDRIETDPAGENLIILGRRAAQQHAALLARTTDPITFTDSSFTIADQTYDQPEHAILHTMQYPERPGRFITIFLANSPEAWSHLNYIQFYSRDTTIIWQGRPVIKRRTYEPDRLIPISN